MKDLVKYAVDQTVALLNIDSPTGYTSKAADYVLNTVNGLGFSARKTNKGGVIADLGGRNLNDAILIEAHIDTLGCMVAEIKSDGRLRLTNLGGVGVNNIEAENCRVITKFNGIFEGTVQLINPSIHVNHDYRETKRDFDSVELVVDEDVSTKEDAESIGIRVGDLVCFDTRTRILPSGYIKSRFLDDKLSSGILLALAKYISDNQIIPERKIYLHFTVYEEVGHGGSASVPEGITEALSVDMGCVGKGISCTEKQVSICAKDAGGPYSYEMVKKLLNAAIDKKADYAMDVYPYYGSDVEATLRGGADIRHGLIGPGVYASHGYERSHQEAVKNTLLVLLGYLGL